MGGALTVLAAVHVPEADAAAVWYGCPPLEYVDADKIKMPLMGHWALDDAYFSIDQVEGLERKLTAAGVQFEFHRYKAQHAFANDHAAEEIAANPGIAIGYDPAAAELAWQRTLGFFKHHLG